MTSHTLPTTAPRRTHSLRDPAYLAFALLRTAFTVAPIVFGLDKFFNLLTTCGRAVRTPSQVQERLTQQVADWLQAHVAPRGVGVVVEAEHLCMTMRGVAASGATTVTSALHGQLRSDVASRAEFFSLISANQQKEVHNA
jgi:GTP cyclohydrolase I